MLRAGASICTYKASHAHGDLFDGRTFAGTTDSCCDLISPASHQRCLTWNSKHRKPRIDAFGFFRLALWSYFSNRR